MKKGVHPTWYSEAKVTCACGNSFKTGATTESISVDVCYKCHPFYTGQMKYVDTAGRVDAFKARLVKATDKVISKTEKRRLKKERRLKEEEDRPDTLEALRTKK